MLRFHILRSQAAALCRVCVCVVEGNSKRVRFVRYLAISPASKSVSKLSQTSVYITVARNLLNTGLAIQFSCLAGGRRICISNTFPGMLMGPVHSCKVPWDKKLEASLTVTALSTLLSEFSVKLLSRLWGTPGYLLEVTMGQTGGWPSLLCTAKVTQTLKATLKAPLASLWSPDLRRHTLYPMPPVQKTVSLFSNISGCSRGLHGSGGSVESSHIEPRPLRWTE